MADIIQIRRDLAANWTSVNPTLADGEFGFEKDTGSLKIGNGTDDWNTLPYRSSPSSVAWGNITGTLSAQTDLESALDLKVDKVTGKQLSTEDYTTAEKTKLAGIQSGAQVNDVTKAYVDTADATLQTNIDAKSDKATTITINGVTNDLSTNREWSITNNPSDSQIFSGCKESWSGSGLTFDVTPGNYEIQGAPLTFAGDNKTLTAADATYGRFDVLALNTAEQLVVITGTPGINPDIPQVDPDTQLYLTAIFVDAGATTPTQISQGIIYNENTEWTGSVSGLTANFADTAAPFSGTKDINVTASTNGGYLKLVNASTLQATDYTLLKLYLRLQASLSNQSNIVLSFYRGNTKVSNSVTLASAYNFTKSTVGSYQNISINLSAFAFTQSAFDTLRITFTGTAFSAFYLDYIQLQGVPGSTTVVNVQDATTTTKGILKLAGDLAGTADAPTVPGLATLQTNITNEATARAAADTTLQNNINLKLNTADYNDRFKGKYTTLAALQTAHPTANAGDYAQVDAGAGSNVINYNYDVEDGWIQGGSGSSATNTDALPEGSTNLYFTTARAVAAVDISGKVDKNTAITGATKTKITYDAKGLVTSGADATTADITDSVDKRYVTDAELTVIANTSGTNTGDQAVPVKATASELNTGTDDAKFATSLALEGSKYLNQSGSKISATASGTDTYTATISPAITAYSASQRWFIKFTNANTGAATLNLNSIGAIAIKKNVSTALAAGDIAAGQILCLAYDGTNFQIVGSSSSASGGGSGIPYVVATGTNTYTATPSPALTSYTAGLSIAVKVTTNTGASTINLNSLGAKSIQINGVALKAGDMIGTVILVYDGTAFQLQRTVLPNGATKVVTTDSSGILQTTYSFGDLYLLAIDDSAGIKTNAQMNTTYPTAVEGNRVRGSNGTYENFGLFGWVYYAFTII